MKDAAMVDSDATESNFTLHNNNSSIKHAPSTIDEPSEKNSNVTSNLDSVESYLNNNSPAKPRQKLDLNMMNAQINADQYSTEHL